MHIQLCFIVKFHLVPVNGANKKLKLQCFYDTCNRINAGFHEIYKNFAFATIQSHQTQSTTKFPHDCISKNPFCECLSCFHITFFALFVKCGCKNRSPVNTHLIFYYSAIQTILCICFFISLCTQNVAEG